MTCLTVTNQQELNDALANTEPSCIHIDSERGVWLRLESNQRHTIEVRGSSSVVARGSSSVVARGSSSVVARGSSSVVAWGSSSVVARGSSSVEAWGSSSVEAWDSSSVVAWGSSSVVARGSSSVVAWDSSSVEAWGSSSVVARDSSSVVARGSSSVVAWDSSSVVARGASHVKAYNGTVKASPSVAVHLHTGQARVEGGVLIDLTQLDLKDAATWCEHHGVPVQDGRAILYKAVNKDLAAGLSYIPTTYTVGAEVVATDWRDDNSCGRGLHLSPHPLIAGTYEGGPCDTRRYLRCSVALEDLRPIDDSKCKVRALRVEAEVDGRKRELAQDLVGA